MNTIKVDLGSKVEDVTLYPIADFHVGSAHFNQKGFEQLITDIENDESAKVIVNGDVINNAVRTGVSDIYEEQWNPQESLEYTYQQLSRIREKIIGIVPGNHENRTYKSAGIDVIRNLAERLDVFEFYDPIANIIFLSFGKSRGRENVRNTFSIYHTHGAGGGRTLGGKANKLERLTHIAVNADVYIHSHTHQPIIFKKDNFIVDHSNKGVGRATQLMVNTNAYEGYGGYGEAFSYPPSNMEYVKVTLSYDNKGVKYKKAVM